MKRSRLIEALLFSVILTVFCRQTAAQITVRQNAMDAFTSGDYETAWNLFGELLKTYPKDPLYKYYSGICLVKTEKDPGRAQKLLNEAINGSAAIRTVPTDAMFYLGCAQQMSGNFEDAILSFENFAASAGKRSAREMGVNELIRECEERRGKIAGNIVPEAVNPENIKVEVNTADTLKAGLNSIPPSLEKSLDAKLEKFLEYDSLTAVPQKADSSVKEVKPPVADILINKPLTEEKVTSKNPGQEVFADFRIVEKALQSEGAEVVIDKEIPAGLVYLIQLAVFRNPVSATYFKGITPVFGQRNQASGVTTYYAGMFRKMTDASAALSRVRSLGFRDAFIAAFSDRKPVSPERAGILEKEWGGKALYTTNLNPQPGDTVPPTLVFRVEIKRSAKPLAKQEVDNMKKMAGSRGFDIIEPEKGKFIYLAGTFISYKSASEYADLLIRNGFRDSKVAAYLGKREIPVETARQLFENY